MGEVIKIRHAILIASVLMLSCTTTSSVCIREWEALSDSTAPVPQKFAEACCESNDGEAECTGVIWKHNQKSTEKHNQKSTEKHNQKSTDTSKP